MHFRTLLKSVTALACCLLFTWLSLFTFLDFIEKNTTVVKSTRKLSLDEQTKVMPVVLICSKMAYLDPLMPMFTIQNFTKNTVDVKDSLLLDYFIFSYKTNTVSKYFYPFHFKKKEMNEVTISQFQIINNKNMWITKDFFTFYHGRCLSLKLETKVDINFIE